MEISRDTLIYFALSNSMVTLLSELDSYGDNLEVEEAIALKYLIDEHEALLEELEPKIINTNQLIERPKWGKKN